MVAVAHDYGKYLAIVQFCFCMFLYVLYLSRLGRLHRRIGSLVSCSRTFILVKKWRFVFGPNPLRVPVFTLFLANQMLAIGRMRGFPR